MSLVLLALASVGLLLCAVQLGSVLRHLRERPPLPKRLPPISILKPLCGVDDDLVAHLALFAQLPYPDYELVLGVRDKNDEAYPMARAAAKRWPGRVRLVLQRGEPGRNPKVNQLVTLAAHARHELLVVSDSNVRVERDYLHQIAAYLEDRSVGLVTHPVVGEGESKLGALLDNLHLAADVGPGMIGAKRVAGQDLVVGKSMALRRRDLDELGGFDAVADVLAEDYVLGRRVASELRKRVVVAHRPVFNVSRRKSVRAFMDRYRRWSVIHRAAVGPFVYSGQLLLNPIALALLAAAITPSLLGSAAIVCGAKIAVDGASARALRGRLQVSALLAVPLKDLLLALCWIHGALHRTVEWRGNRLRVHPGTHLTAPRRARAWVNAA